LFNCNWNGIINTYSILNNSLSFAITWIIFRVYLHFVIYCYRFYFFTNIIFLIIALFCNWLILFWIQYMKTSFNIGLVEVECYIVLKNNIWNNISWPP
jgi:hypothetical protein